MSPEALKAIKARLPKGYRLLIKRKTGLSASYIDRVLNGTRENKKVIEAALSVIEESVEANQQTYERLNKIIAIGQ